MGLNRGNGVGKLGLTGWKEKTPGCGVIQEKALTFSSGEIETRH